MKRFIYVDALTNEERAVDAKNIAVTENGELLFLDTSEHEPFTVAGVAPGFWSRFWTEGEIPQRSNLPIPDDDQS